MSPCFANVCRVCMQESEGLHSLASPDEDFIEHKAKLYFCIPTMIDDEKYPQQLCGACTADLRIAYAFKQKCLNSMCLMSEMLRSETRVKQEPLELTEEKVLAQEDAPPDTSSELLPPDPDHCYTRSQEQAAEQLLPVTQLKDELMSEEEVEEQVQDEDEAQAEQPPDTELRESVLHPLFPLLDGEDEQSQHQQRDPVPQSSSSLYCSLCDEGFEPEQLAHHRALHADLRSVTCPLCRRQFGEPHQIDRFFRHYCIRASSRASSMLTCPVCKRQFKNSQALANHCKVHRGSERHKCHFCHLYFSSMQQLSWHYRNGVHPDKLTNKLKHLK